jgi:hypothetical protein
MRCRNPVAFQALRAPSLSSEPVAFCLFFFPLQVVHIHTAEEECSVLDLLTIQDKDGAVKKRPRFARQGAMITARMQVGW